jgi:carbonic anhydrase/acetyltransferase-like protein (isoleucine patch superfamily)
VGAGALVVEKMIVADNTLVVGAPARKIRNNDDATVRLIEQAAEIYFERWQTFASALKRVL